MAKADRGCDERAAELQRWFESLPEGVAEISTAGRSGNEERAFEIAPRACGSNGVATASR